MYRVIIEGLEFEIEGYESIEAAVAEAIELYAKFSGFYVNACDLNISVIDYDTDIEYIWDDYNEEWKDIAYSDNFEL